MKARLTMPVFSSCHEHNWQANGRGKNPVADIDNFGISGGTEIKGLDWVANSHIAIHTHGAECEDTGEHIVVVYGYDNLTKDGTKWPGSHQVIHTLEWQSTCG